MSLAETRQGLSACLPPIPAGGCVPGDDLVQRNPLNDLSNGEIVGPNTPPGDAWSGRFSQFDFRVARVIEMAGTANVRAAFDVHNLFNGAAVSRERYGLGPTYLQPTGLQPGRMAKVSFQLNF